MKAIVRTEYGSPGVLKVQEIEKPIPRDNEILVKIHATTVTAGDCELRRFDISALFWLPLRLYMGIWKPRIKVLGQEFAGKIEAVGKAVTQFKVGEEVFGPTQLRMGAYAEYICLPATHTLARKPSNISYKEAATIPTGGLNALHFIRKAKILQGHKVLICGAGGSIGTYAIQLAKLKGAIVTCVDSLEKLEQLRAIGADQVIDHRAEDFAKNGETYDVIIDVVGKTSYSESLRSLKAYGRYILGNPGFIAMMRSLWTSKTSDKKVIFEFAGYAVEDMVFLSELMEAGKLRALIDKCYPLEKVPEAHKYVEKGYKTGNAVISVAE